MHLFGSVFFLDRTEINYCQLDEFLTIHRKNWYNVWGILVLVCCCEVVVSSLSDLQQKFDKTEVSSNVIDLVSDPYRFIGKTPTVFMSQHFRPWKMILRSHRYSLKGWGLLRTLRSIRTAYRRFQQGSKWMHQGQGVDDYIEWCFDPILVGLFWTLTREERRSPCFSWVPATSAWNRVQKPPLSSAAFRIIIQEQASDIKDLSSVWAEYDIKNFSFCFWGHMSFLVGKFWTTVFDSIVPLMATMSCFGREHKAEFDQYFMAPAQPSLNNAAQHSGTKSSKDSRWTGNGLSDGIWTRKHWTSTWWTRFKINSQTCLPFSTVWTHLQDPGQWQLFPDMASLVKCASPKARGL